MCNLGSWAQCRNIKVQALSIHLPADWDSGCLWGPTIAMIILIAREMQDWIANTKHQKSSKKKTLLFPFKESLFIIIIVFNFNRGVVDLQYCVSFWYIAKWFRCVFPCIYKNIYEYIHIYTLQILFHYKSLQDVLNVVPYSI